MPVNRSIRARSDSNNILGEVYLEYEEMKKTREKEKPTHMESSRDFI